MAKRRLPPPFRDKPLTLELLGRERCNTPGCGTLDVVRIGKVYKRVCQQCGGAWALSYREMLKYANHREVPRSGKARPKTTKGS